MKTTAALFAGMSLLSFLAGCSADATDDAASANADLVAPAPIAAGKFDLLTKPRVAPHSCDQLTKLEVKDLSAHMSDSLVSPCMTFAAVDPHTRDYKLTRTGSSCGSTMYEASFTKGGDHWSIKLTDNRARLCRDVIPALIVIEETHNGTTEKLYSNDAQPSAAETTVEGTVEHVMGIGGETTGVAIFTDNGSYELIVDAAERAKIVDGKKARVKGKKTTLSGVETHDRPAIDVSDLLVCPSAGYINCMPGGPVPEACQSDNRSWINANCEDVDFAD
jgi:hypothetical protein